MAANIAPRRAFAWLASLLGIDLLLALLILRKLAFVVPEPEYSFPALQFAATHHIHSVFLPIGYSTLLGLGDMLFHGTRGMEAVNVLLYLLWSATIFYLLRRTTSGNAGAPPVQALLIALIFSFYPDVFLSINKVMDATITSLLLLAVWAAILHLLRHSGEARRWADDLLLGLVFGCVLLTRTNLALMLPVSWIAFWHFRLPKKFLRAAAHGITALLLYAAVTMLVHGSVFFPHNGPYNLFAGANEDTEQVLLHSMNAEDSLPDALKSRGITADVHWLREENQPGMNDTRDAQFEPLYRAEAAKYMRAHPAEMVKLSAIKLFTLLRPDLRLYSWHSAGGLMKIFAACALPLWLIVFFAFPRPSPLPDYSRLIVPMMLCAYILPFVLTIAAPRFRVPLDILCFVDTASMLLARFNAHKGAASQTTPANA